MKKGFTLVELLVAIGLFSIIVSIAIGGFVNALKTQRQVAALIATQSNAGLALEQMTREIRTGYLFNIDAGATQPNDASLPYCAIAQWNGGGPGAETWTCSVLNFTNAQGDPVSYTRGSSTSTDEILRNGSPITGDNVKIESLSFQLFGNMEGDHWPPRITISMSVAPSSTDPSLQSDIINLQTTVSAREMDCESGVPASAGC